jgi:hypothetical protein
MVPILLFGARHYLCVCVCVWHNPAAVGLALMVRGDIDGSGESVSHTDARAHDDVPATITTATAIACSQISGVHQLDRFMEILAVINTSPISGHRTEDDNITNLLITSHMALIVTEDLSDAVTTLAPDPVKNIICNTPQQLASNAILAKLIAAILLASPHTGNLFNVYSTSLFHATELVKLAKSFVLYYINTLDPSVTAPLITATPYNHGVFAVTTADGLVKSVSARPSSFAPTKGDTAPSAIFTSTGFFDDVSLWRKTFNVLYDLPPLPPDHALSLSLVHHATSNVPNTQVL